MKNALLLVALAATPTWAQQSGDIAPPNQSISTTVPASAPTTSTQNSVLDSYGVVSSQHLVTALSANLTSEQRAQIDQAVATRNAALTQANSELHATLRNVLGETDEGLKRRIMAPREAYRMEQMRRAQPARYLHLMTKRKKQLKLGQ